MRLSFGEKENSKYELKSFIVGEKLFFFFPLSCLASALNANISSKNVRLLSHLMGWFVN